MAEINERDSARIAARRRREHYNIFARLPAIYAASRKQGQHLLQMSGGLSIVEWRVLWDLYEAGPMTIKDLALMQRADHSLLSRALPKIRRKGYVTMQRSETDSRQTVVEISQAGRRAYDRAAPIMARRRAALKEVYSAEELVEFVNYLDRLDLFLQTPIEESAAKDQR